ncbi:MAG: hypothetical protein NT069_24595 [Planctomycetota bacterium]|nr:hypothetical protein [Planctomycetota bacterium]
MGSAEQVDDRGIALKAHRGFRFRHESDQVQPEVVSHDENGLHVLAVASSQGLRQLGIHLTSMGMQPLFELIQDDQDLLASGKPDAVPQRVDRINQANVSRLVRQSLAQSIVQTDFGLLGAGLNEDTMDPRRKSWQQPGLHQRTLAAARRSDDHANPERRVVRILDSVLPKADALGQTLRVDRTGQKSQKELGIVGVV